MIPFARTDNSLLSRWWWTVDRWTLAAMVLLAIAGLVIAASASLPAAERLGLGALHFVTRQAAFAALGIAIALGLSLMARGQIQRLAVVLFAASLVLVVATLVFGPERQGAARWLSLGGFSLQPSEFLKPAAAVVFAAILARRHAEPTAPVFQQTALLALLSVVPLALQPDIGQSFLIGAIWAMELFLAGAPLVLFLGLAFLAVAALTLAYFALPYVANRIQIFIDPASGDSFQLQKSLAAFRNGGVFGTGPSGGEVKKVLPDAYADHPHRHFPCHRGARPGAAS
jgi:cell division protein FtsW